MTSGPISLVDRAGLDRPRLAKILSRGLDGADDGELFLEYRQSEALAFDNGRLKQATYDTSQGFGLRAVKDEAVGYAHASDVSEAAIERAADAVRAVKGGYSGRYAAPPARTQREALRRGQSARRSIFRSQGAAPANHRRLCARQGSAGAPGFGESRRHLAGGRDFARRRRDLSRRAAAGAGPCLGRGRRRRPPGDRQRRLWRPRGLRALHRDRRLARRGRQCGAPGAGQSRSGAGAGRRDGCRARPGLAGRHAARGRRSRPGRRLQPQEDFGLRRAAWDSASPPRASPWSTTAP